MKHHLKQANYQAYICKHVPELRNPEGPVDHRWQLINGELEIVWTEILPAPESAWYEVRICGGNCQTRRCSCVTNSSEVCLCLDKCANCRERKKDSHSSPPQNTVAAQLNEVGLKTYIGVSGCRYTDHAWPQSTVSSTGPDEDEDNDGDEDDNKDE